MKYFIIQSNKFYEPNIINWYHKIDIKTIYKKNIDNPIILDMETSENFFMPDIICFPIFMVSKGVAQIIYFYEDNINFKEVILFDVKKRRNGIYFIPLLKEVDCINKETEFNLDKTIIKRLVLNKNDIEHNTIFRLGEIKSNYIIGRLDLVESILRREAKGIKLIEVKTVV